MSKWLGRLLAVGVGVAMWAGMAGKASAADPAPLPRQFYYPYHYFPHNYWPQNSPTWPEKPGQAPMKNPAYMAYPPFREPGWRYELFEPMRYYRGHHFWLDQF